MRIKVIITTFLLLTMNTFAFGQTYFSKVYNFGFPNVVFSNILQEGDSLLIIGVITDNEEPLFNSIVLTTDMEGTVGQVNKFQHNYGAFDAWRKNLHRLNDSTYVLGVESYYPNSQAGIILFNKKGEIKNSDFRLNPLYPEEEFVVSNDILYTESKQIYYSLKNVNIETNAEIKLYKYNDSFALLDSVDISLDHLGNLFALEESLDNHLLLGMYQFQLTDKDFTYENIIQKRDTNFNLIWEYKTEHDSLFSSLRAITSTSDMGLVAVTFTGTEYYINPGSNGYCRDDIYIYKLDSNGELIWDKTIPTEDCNPNLKYISNIKELNDKTLLLAGTIPYNNKFRGILMKLNSEGDILWERYYIHEEKDFSNFHIFNDMAVLDNGDLVMCGESNGPQEGWIMKVDSMGCLIPGCTTAIEEISSENPIEILLYPNPVQDQLMVHLAIEESYKDGHFQLVDINGQVLKNWDNSMSDVTHIIDVSKIPAGKYQLLYMYKGQIIDSKGLVKI